MSGAILITGATGTIGRQLVALWLNNTDSELYLLLHEKGRGCDPAALLRELLVAGRGEEPSLSLMPGLRFAPSIAHAPTSFVQRLHLLAGDIAAPQLGLPDETYASLAQRITGIVHAAALTRFDAPIDQARRINVEGTRQVSRLAQLCRRLETIGFLSTAYVSGKRTGVIYEDDLTHSCGFVNSYEQSKYEAEELIMELRSGLPASIYRLSTLAGDSKTGKVTHFTAPHLSLQIMHIGLAAMVPGTPDYSVDLIPSDYAAGAVFQLFSRHPEEGRTFHITAGPAKSLTLEVLIDESYRYLAEFDSEWARRDYPKPLIVSREAFHLSLQTVEQARNTLMFQAMKTVSHFADQLTYPKRFDTTHLLRCLPDYERDLPHIRDYYGKVVRYCLATRWQRNV